MLTPGLRRVLWLLLAAGAVAVAWYLVRVRIDVASGAGSQQAALPAWKVPAMPPPSGPSVLVLYDVAKGTQFEKLGRGYAVMLGNLLGHFDARVQLLPVGEYTSGLTQQVDATFYLGTVHNSEIPQAFLQDALVTTKPLVWFKYNLWKLPGTGTGLSEARGFSFLRLHGFDSEPTGDGVRPGFFDTVTYKGLPFVKFYRYDTQKAAPLADPEVGQVKVTDPERARVLLDIANAKTGESTPYVVRSGNFWYMADLPLTFIGPRDRYLVLADLLHDMLGIDHAEEHKAMIRLEDIHAMVNPDSIRRVVDYLQQRSVPFSLAVIPHYRDPLGTYNHGTPLDIPLSRANSLRRTLDYAVQHGGEIVAHGYTHQLAETRNPSSGVSAEDYEFWDAVNNRPPPHDSTEWALQRLHASVQELRSNGYTPVAWTTPHYQASPLFFRAVPQVFSTTYQRVTYYTSEQPELAPHGVHDFVSWQFYPYVIARDYYGQRVLPENLGNVQYMVEGKLTDKALGYSVEDLVTNARYARTVRDGFASFFFHPFLLDVPEVNGWEQLTRTVEGVSALGYEWTSPTRLDAPGPRQSAMGAGLASVAPPSSR